MKQTVISQAVKVLPVLLLAACAGGGGSFDLDNVETKKTDNPPKAEYKDEDTAAKPQMQTPQNAAYGFAVKLPRRNWHPRAGENHKALSEADWEALGEGAPDAFAQKDEIQNMNDGELKESLTAGDGKSRVTGYTDFQYVRSGYIYRNARSKIDAKNLIALSGPVGYIFYKGSTPSQALPSSKAVYKGTWDYTTDAKKGQRFDQLGSSSGGDRAGVFSAVEDGVVRETREAAEGQTDFGLTSEFELDFSAKTLKGALYRNNRLTNNESESKDKQTKRYDIQATLQGNRFQGKALATDKNADNGHPFVADADNLEGGFYGPKGEELAGKFLSNDNKVAAVFGAKQKDGEAQTLTETIADAYRIGEDFVKKQLDTFGNVFKLLIGGTEISLLPDDAQKNAFTHEAAADGVKATVCCSNLSSMNFGLLEQNGAHGMFVQGERTAVSAMPTTGEDVLYRGTWFGRIENKTSWSGDASNQDGDNRAEFKVNFADKTLSGTLIAKDRINPAFTIDAVIQGNGFSGTAKTAAHGFALDPKNTIDPQYTRIQADVSGGFYGATAGELGGSFAGNTLAGEAGRASVVFGAKRQQLVK